MTPTSLRIHSRNSSDDPIDTQLGRPGRRVPLVAELEATGLALGWCPRAPSSSTRERSRQAQLLARVKEARAFVGEKGSEASWDSAPPLVANRPRTISPHECRRARNGNCAGRRQCRAHGDGTHAR